MPATGPASTLLAEHHPADAQEREYLARIRGLVQDDVSWFSRQHFEPGHVTASGFVVSPDGRKLLLIHHAKLDMWLQPGGHVDPEDGSLELAARREVMEETGLRELLPLPGFPRAVDVDVHVIPANPRKGEPGHRHYDVRFAFWATDEALQAGSDALDARWVPLEQVRDAGTDDSVRRAVRKLSLRLKGWASMEPACWPAAERNKQPILEVLQRWIPEPCRVLEIASGTGQHAAWFAEGLPHVQWQPSDASVRYWQSIHGRRLRSGLPNLLPVVPVDVLEPLRPMPPVDVVYCANMIHIAPWEATDGLFRSAASVLREGRGQLITYGPFQEAGVPMVQSNVDFDAHLRSRDPRWGIRHLDDVARIAAEHGFRLVERLQMPANNLMLRWERAGD